ncbi:maleylpyruvate isomerase family mycothiol-dependent enzyme [Rhabdothermincola salaria]|uniref:maleylpyruvate isomerase family mycothiol-dependent enzyme n=1 Tax=Rhabdothermincola salaria TaxID=2903142 RepID=UPI001E521BBB|nr:maleylpyruvate isomerase family mycothiol-dependent enzyme [Rhabdothermincola salaria]MCD9624123.1 maleylpyruvate isomerase family mycothiol-dependent enzyme [Rhabdothermincola salaria]
MDHVETIRREGTALVEAAEAAGLDTPVAACPGWDVRRLLQHTAKVHQRTEAVVRTGADSPPPSSEFPRFDDDYRLFAQFRAALDALCLTLEAADPEGRSWNFTSGSGTNAFWPRRMAHETTVHRIDAQRTAGQDADPVPSDQAADGIDELVTVMLPMMVGLKKPDWNGSIHLHCTDQAGEWTLRLEEGALAVSRDHEKGDLAVRGPAAGMFLWAWNRADPADVGLECFGDTALLEAWTQLVP